MLKRMIYICLLLGASSCSWMSAPCPDPIERPALKLPRTRPLKMERVKFKVLLLDDGSGGKVSMFALSESDYKNLSLNMGKIKSLVREQNKIIELYRNYYESERSDATSNNKKK